MPLQRTLSIIKPDAVAKNVIGQIYARFEAAGLKVVAARMAFLSRQEAEGFYAVHRERPFFKDLVAFMISGPVMIQVLVNLIGNAVKYTSQRAEAEITIAPVGVQEGRHVLMVRDNGAGFDMAYADQLFQPFKRLHAHHEFEGTGIGLATVARVLQRHGGSIRGEGVVGQGATFCFSVPVEPQRPYADSAGDGR